MTELNITFEDDGVILFWFRMSGVCGSPQISVKPLHLA